MNSKSKGIAVFIILLIAISSPSLLIVHPACAQSVSASSVPDFTLKYVNNSYDMAPTATSSTDPYTGITTSTTIPGRHVEDKTIEVAITNNIGASYYGLRFKGHYSDSWTYFPYNGPDDHNIMDGFFLPAFQASNSSYTEGSLYLGLLPQPIPEGAPIDVQVQALFGNFEVTPYGHIIYVGGPTYDAIFKGTTSDWSNTQIVTIGQTSPSTFTSTNPTTITSTQNPTRTPIIPEFSWLTIQLLLLAIPIALVIVRKGLQRNV